MKKSSNPSLLNERLSVTPDAEPVRTSIDMFTTEMSDLMHVINDQGTGKEDSLNILTDSIMASLDSLALTQSVLNESELSGDELALANRVVASDITKVRALQERYNILALDTTDDMTLDDLVYVDLDDDSPAMKLLYLQAKLSDEINAITIRTPTGEQAIDFSVLDEKQNVKPSDTIDTPVAVAAEKAHDVSANDSATPTFDNLAEQYGLDANEFGDVSAILDNENAFGNVDSILDKEATGSEAQPEFGDVSAILNNENSFGNVDSILDNEVQSEFGDVSAILDNKNTFGDVSSIIGAETIDDKPKSAFGDVSAILESDNQFGDTSAILGDNTAESFGSVDTILGKNNAFGSVEVILGDQETTGNAAVNKDKPAPAQDKNSAEVVDEPTSLKEKLRNKLFAASLALNQLPQKAVKAYRDYELREELKNPTEKAERDRMLSTRIVMGGVAILGAGLIARHYGWIDGGETIPDVQTVPDVTMPDFPYDPNTERPSFTTPDTSATAIPTPDSGENSGNVAPAPIDLDTHSDAFTVRFGGGGEELMKQLGVSPDKWYDIAPDLLDKFPRDFYAKSGDHSIAGIMRPGELPEDVQKFIAKKLGL